MALAAPSGGQISAGSGQITQSGSKTTINQGSQNLAVNWQSFGIASNERVNFVQPDSSAVALNRVTGQTDVAALRERASREGMKPLRISGALKVAAGVTTLEEVIKVAPPAL